MATTNIGERLRRERLRRSERQDQTAARFGVAQSSYSRWENGQMFPDDKHFANVASYLGMNVEEVWSMVNDDDPRPVTLEHLLGEIAALHRDVADLRNQLAEKTDTPN